MSYHGNYVHRSNVLGAGLIAFVAGAAVWAIFGKRIQEKVKDNPHLRELRRQISEQASKVSEMTQEKYDSLVDEAVNAYAQAKGISKNELRDLISDLKWHGKKIVRSWKEGNYRNDSSDNKF